MSTVSQGSGVGTDVVVGLHHVTAITGDAQKNIDFYTGVLGLRLVKLTVNFDDPSSYHLYYGDALGRPGTILTFFAWPGAPRGRAGTGQTQATAFAVPVDALGFWVDRLEKHKVLARMGVRLNEKVVSFDDPDGMAIELIETRDAVGEHAYIQSTVPVEFAIRGFHGVTLGEMSRVTAAAVLVDHFGYTLAGQEQNRYRYLAPATDGGVAGRVVDVIETPQRMPQRGGAGTVHHIAFRTPGDASQGRWLAQLRKAGYGASPVMDREYFRSIYFREAGGVLFEIATDTPGFAINEAPETLGTTLQLPPWMESGRKQIAANLPQVKVPGVEGVLP